MGVNFTIIPPTKKHDNKTFLIWSIPRPASMREYRLAFLRIQGMLEEFGFTMSEQDVFPVQPVHYAESGNRFRFRQPVKIYLPTPKGGGYVSFDRSLGVDETEFSDIETFMKITNAQVGADQLQDVVSQIQSLSKQFEDLKRAVEGRKATSIPMGINEPSVGKEPPRYATWRPPSWRTVSEPTEGPLMNPNATILCPHERTQLEPSCQVCHERFVCRLWKWSK